MSSVAFPAQPEKILKELSRVWTSLGKEEKELGKPTVLRACAMTLIIATDDEDEDGFTASQTLIELMHEHPSRGIVLRVFQKAEKGLEARVLAQCWKPFGKAQQICCEQIEITASPDSWSDIGPTVSGIMAADLPVVLWSRQKTALSASVTHQQKAGLAAVMQFARKIIVDTLSSDLDSALYTLKGWYGEGRIIADLEWTRLTPWREALANAFDDTTLQSKVSNYRTVDVTYIGDNLTASVLYMGGWLASTLKAKVSFAKAKSGFGTGLQKVTLHSNSDTIELERTSNDCMTLRAGGRERKYSFTALNLYTLMNEELTVLGPDRIFQSAFTHALELRNA
jgi:glucose-6-phosphate dehydrogenase assembly protein OpcA